MDRRGVPGFAALHKSGGSSAVCAANGAKACGWRRWNSDFAEKSAAATSGPAAPPSQPCHADITLSNDGLGHILTQRGGGTDCPPRSASARTGTTRRPGKPSPSGCLPTDCLAPSGRSASRCGDRFGAGERDGPEARCRSGMPDRPMRLRSASGMQPVAGTAWTFGPPSSEAEAPEGRRHEQ